MLERVAAACSRSGRDPRSVSLLAISKAVPVERLRLALAAGIVELGENRVQEAEAKASQLSGVRWHLVGHLQSNKAGPAAQLFATIHSVDTLDLARRLDRLAADRTAGRLGIYLQINVDRDEAKAGFSVAGVKADLPEILHLTHLDVLGLMTVGRLADVPEQARSSFRSLRDLSERMRADQPALGPALSMGMSDDFEVAVEEGATVVRVGRAIFGERRPA